MTTPILQLIEKWKDSSNWPYFQCHRILPKVPPKTAELPPWLHPELGKMFAQRGIQKLYLHQRQCCDATNERKHVVVATPTASGKTLCYNLPVFHSLLSDPKARALYLFPTKALARDQMEEARTISKKLEAQIGVAVYDGDTPPDHRRAARRHARILATNPEMLHMGILPHHTSWSELFSGLRYVVIDELHVYRGIFGSHLANVLRRLARVAKFHGANPLFVATSATIANPAELATDLFAQTDSAIQLVQQNGAPKGEQHFLFYNPPVIDPAIGVRESYLKATCKLTLDLMASKINTLVFCRSRLAVEVLLRYLRDGIEHLPESSADSFQKSLLKARIRSYRGGYLPNQRREVEHALRCGNTDVVVTTSALELGIDIGSIDAVVIAGWPGSRAATWQRAGRAGRRLAPSLSVMVTSSEPIDQYVANDPEYLFEKPSEQARINPDNVSILLPHIRCATYELPFTKSEAFGELSVQETDEVLDCMSQANLLHKSSDTYHYVGDSYPANEVNLRGPLDENFLVVLQPLGKIIAEVDYKDAPQVLHDSAIYQMEGNQYQVEKLDHDNRKAYVTSVDLDYYTDAMTRTQVRVLDCFENSGCASRGEVHVCNRVVGFKKIKLHTHENIGYGDVNQPDREMHTSAFWISLEHDLLQNLKRSPAEIAEASLGAAYALHSTATLLLMSESRDIGRAVGDSNSTWFAVASGKRRGLFATPENGSDLIHPIAPTIFLYDQYPGGTGLAERLFVLRDDLTDRTIQMIERCPCASGCPACIAPGSRSEAKNLSVELLQIVRQIPLKKAFLNPNGTANDKPFSSCQQT